MVDETSEIEIPSGFKPVSSPLSKFLGDFSKRDASGAGNGNKKSPRTIGDDSGSVNSGTIDPTEIAKDRQRKRGRPKLTPEEKAARAAERQSGEKTAELAVEPEPPDPTLIGFATEGLIFLNLALAAKFEAPEIAQISRETDETVARAWLKFMGYYVTLARATGPMGALAAAIVATALAYAPPCFSAAMRKAAEAPQEPQSETLQ